MVHNGRSRGNASRRFVNMESWRIFAKGSESDRAMQHYLKGCINLHTVNSSSHCERNRKERKRLGEWDITTVSFIFIFHHQHNLYFFNQYVLCNAYGKLCLCIIKEASKQTGVCHAYYIILGALVCCMYTVMQIMNRLH